MNAPLRAPYKRPNKMFEFRNFDRIGSLCIYFVHINRVLRDLFFYKRSYLMRIKRQLRNIKIIYKRVYK